MMKRTSKALALCASVAALALSSCQTGDIAAREVGATPTDKSTDEAGLWFQMDKYEENVQKNPNLNRDPELNAYVQNVVCNVTGEYCDDLRVYVVDAPLFNATMAPNGMMTVYSGLLLRTENEAQLSCVVGHEFGHYLENHSLQLWRSAKASSNAALAFAIVTAGAGIGLAGNLGYLVAAGVLADYNRDMEREADDIGYRVSADYGYDSSQCAQVWTNLISEIEASEFKKVRKRANSSNAFSSHPVPTERIENLQALSTEYPGGSDVGMDRHDAAITPFLEDWLEAELKANDYDRHIQLFQDLKARGRNAAVVDFYMGEAYRLRRVEGDEARAIAAWESASTSSDAPAVTWRALGEAYRKMNRDADALEAYQTYLMNDPDASDSALIQKYIDDLKA